MINWIIVCAIAAAGVWYLTADQGNAQTSYNQKLLSNQSAMSECTRKREYAASRMATSAANAEKECAEKLGFYREAGHWHSYKESRQ